MFSPPPWLLLGQITTRSISFFCLTKRADPRLKSLPTQLFQTRQQHNNPIRKWLCNLIQYTHDRRKDKKKKEEQSKEGNKTVSRNGANGSSALNHNHLLFFPPFLLSIWTMSRRRRRRLDLTTPALETLRFTHQKRKKAKVTCTKQLFPFGLFLSPYRTTS